MIRKDKKQLGYDTAEALHLHPPEAEMSMRFPVATSSAAISPEATLASVEVLLSKLALSYWSEDDWSALWTALGGGGGGFSGDLM